MIGLNGHKLYWEDNDRDYKECSIYLKSYEEPELWRQCLNDDNSLNSTKVLNIFKSALSNISHYSNADIHRMQQAVTLELPSYEWNFDLVPCFHTTSNVYLIPNGSGKWMKTNPEKDKELITSVNQKHSGKFLELVRLVKYWNSKSFANKSKFQSSYLLEIMLAKYYDRLYWFSDLETEFKNSLTYLYSALDINIADPKGIEGNINRLNANEKLVLKNRICCDLIELTKANESDNIIKKFDYWKNVLGQNFPDYEV
ncbi:SMODS domain-containing nucleotidyltransferase [Actinobacillus equuli]|uniref:Nucleotidyltransferase n=2 Tax=Actinobacillus equuli TaxID=718 RepID=A0AAX3FLJ4_ACTEU|nr:Uncharacterised protein [Actinobacillus equuli]